MAHQLVNDPQVKSLQHKFECMLRDKFGIRRGVLAIGTGNNYINDHIDWMWTEFKMFHERPHWQESLN